MSPAKFDTLRSLWRHDWEAMKRGTYTAPLPHPSRIVDLVRPAAEGAAVVVLVCVAGVVW